MDRKSDIRHDDWGIEMREIGFWDYTAADHGSLEHYTEADWDVLLDDMAEGGFNSLTLGIKWITTGYRSRFDWLDQDPDNAAVKSDNRTVRYGLEQARRRGIRTWLLVVATQFNMEKFKLGPVSTTWGPCGIYDLDVPGLGDRIEMLFDEVTSIFGDLADGIVVELEFCDSDQPHRIPIYNEWAAQNGRPDYAAIRAQLFDPRGYPMFDWRDFTTSRRIEMLGRIEKVVRARGFNGTLSTIAELGNAPMVLVGNMNLEMLKTALPHWSLTTYDSIYDRRANRLATMDFCIEQPRKLGFDVLYLTRGVMSWNYPADAPPFNLEEQWRMSLEDAAAHNPDILWFMGSDARRDGIVCSNVKLPAWGFDDPRVARKRLMEMARERVTRSEAGG